MASETQPILPYIAKDFDTSVATYKNVNELDINVDIHVPKAASPNSKHPVAIVIHGGGLVTGTRRHPLMLMGPWVAQWAAKHSAIVLCPDTRLAPETKHPAIREDCLDFFAWVKSSLNGHLAQLATPVEADVSRIVMRGESAGGWCALHIALEYPQDIKGLILAWPMVDLRAANYAQGANKPILGRTADKAVLEAQLAEMEQRTVERASGADNLSQLTLGAFEHGLVYRIWGVGDQLFPLDKVEQGRALPKRVWLTHGLQDSVVPATGSKRLEELIHQHVPGTSVRADYLDGEHGFDNAVALQEPWLAEGTAWMDEEWLN